MPHADFAQGLGTPKIIRSMPNTPAMIERGVTVWSESKDYDFSSDEQQLCEILLGSFGTQIKVEDEKVRCWLQT